MADINQPDKNESISYITLFGQKFVSANMASVVSQLERYRSERIPRQICISNVHTTMMACQNEDFYNYIKNASISTMDGKPLVWLAKFLGAKNSERVAGPDLLAEVCRISPARKYRHYFYGGAEGVPEKLKTFFD